MRAILRSLACFALPAATALALTATAAAQYTRNTQPVWNTWPGGFVAGGRGGTANSLFTPKLAGVAGYQIMTGSAMQIGARAVLGYASFNGDADAYREALHVASASTVEGGGATVLEEGGDLVLADRSGPVVLHGFYGLRYFQQSRGDTRVQNGLATDTVRYHYRRDFGRSYGFGATLQMSTGGGIYGEWFRTQPYDHRMIRQRGLRFGVSWTH
ncbi:MAG: hypothetical protein JWM27_404 [Gemmatimonadetes bacterium]|nr:hypothetical protein [Gemmatimonadota bacterium]